MQYLLEKIADWIKVKVALSLIAIIWASLILFCLPLMTVAYLYDKNNPKVAWLYSLFLAQDYLVNAILGGDHNTTISANLGHLKRNGSETGRLAALIVDWLFYIARREENHCVNAIREGDVYIFSARRALAGSSIYLITLYCIYETIGLLSNLFASMDTYL